ncbi:MAG: universal stress protein [Dehalococcoidales bacterium]|nr:universal stress protein [Dehalococcoidales bacterium]
MSNRILVPLDGSPTGESALLYLKNYFSETDPKDIPEFVLLQVVNPPLTHLPVEGGNVDVPNIDAWAEQQQKAAMDYLEVSAEILKNIGAEVRCEVIINDTDTSSADAIIQAETELAVNLVAMSTHGRRGLRRFALGSVTEKVLRGGNVPVLMVRARK